MLKQNYFIKILKLSLITICSASLVNCGAGHTMLNKRTLNVQTKMSDTIFLDPVAADKKIIFVQMRNTSDKGALNLQNGITHNLLSKGYTVVDDPDKAHYLLQANILQVGQCDLRAADVALNQGYGSMLGGAAVGAAIGSLSSHHSDALVLGGLLGGAVGGITDALVKDIAYSVVADIQVSERASKQVVVREKTRSKLKQGTSGDKEVFSTEKTGWKRYQTRIIITANKVNLKFEQALPLLSESITQSIAGIF